LPSVRSRWARIASRVSGRAPGGEDLRRERPRELLPPLHGRQAHLPLGERESRRPDRAQVRGERLGPRQQLDLGNDLVDEPVPERVLRQIRGAAGGEQRRPQAGPPSATRNRSTPAEKLLPVPVSTTASRERSTPSSARPISSSNSMSSAPTLP
jgi:hypothetical protein